MNPNTQLDKAKAGVEMSFIPFGATDPIKLSIAITKNFVAVPTRSGKLPSDRDCMRFMMLCQAQKLNPFAGDAFMIGYDGQNGPTFSLITAQVALLKRAEASPEFEGMQSGVILLLESGEIKEREGDFHLPDENVVGGWAKVTRKGRTPFYRRIRMARFNKGIAQWKEDAAGMICKCAEADALRSAFPTLLGGLYTHGEILDVTATVTSIRATDIPASQLVDVRPAGESQEQAGARGEQEQEPPQERKPEPSNGSKAELEKLITEAGFTFNHFQVWAKETGQIENADSLPSFEEVPEAVAKRLVRAKPGLLKGLADVKGAEA